MCIFKIQYGYLYPLENTPRPNIMGGLIIGGSLVIAFGYLPQNFGRWWGPMNGTFSFYECGGDAKTFKCEHLHLGVNVPAIARARAT